MPQFSQDDFELRGELPKEFLSEEQYYSLLSLEDQVKGQLTWIAQLLGWNGPEYWSDLVSTPAEMRRVLAGTFGIYGYLTFPVIRQARNWDYTLEVVADRRIKANQILHCGEHSTTISSISYEGNL